MQTTTSIDKVLKKLMDFHRINQVRLNKETGVTQSTISRILKQGIKDPSDKQIKKIADYFGLTTDQLRGYTPIPEEYFFTKGRFARPAVPKYDDLPDGFIGFAAKADYGNAYRKTVTPEDKIKEKDSSYSKEPTESKKQMDLNITHAPSFSGTKLVPVISNIQAGAWAEAVDPYVIGDAESWEPAPASCGEHSFWLKVVGDSMTAPSGLSVPEGHLILVDPDVAPKNGSLVVAKMIESNEVTFKRLITDVDRSYLKPLNPTYRTIEIEWDCEIVGVVIEAKVKF